MALETLALDDEVLASAICDGGRGGSGAVGSSGSGEGVAAAGGLEGCSRGDGDGRQCSSISWSWWATNCDTGSG